MTRKDVGERVRELRLSRGIRQGVLAARLGLTYGALNHFEKGRRCFYFDQLEEIADALDVPVAIFLQDGDFREIRLLHAWRALRSKRALRRVLLQLMTDLARRGL